MSVSDWLFGKDEPKTTSAGTLSPEQEEYLKKMMPLMMAQYGQGQSMMGTGEATGFEGLGLMKKGAQSSSYQALSPQYFQEAVANPFTQKRQEAWSDIQANMAGRGAGMHGSAMTKIKNKYDLETQGQLQQQQQNFLLGERGLQMQGLESLYGRQMGAGQGMAGYGQSLMGYGQGMMSGVGMPLGIQTKENIAYKETGTLNKAGQVISAGVLGGQAGALFGLL